MFYQRNQSKDLQTYPLAKIAYGSRAALCAGVTGCSLDEEGKRMEVRNRDTL